MQRENQTPIVTITVCTYNQEHWIKQTLDSILAQDTAYPFEIIIGEDWGTDGTRAICEDYAKRYDNVFMAPSDHNLGITAHWINCIRHGTGKYLMACAGDDFWHNPHKIQLQVDFMEKHPECVVCHTDIDELYVKSGKLKHNAKASSGIFPPEGRIQREVLDGNCHVSAVTMCIRRDAFEKYVPADKFIELQSPREDWPTLLVLSAYGDICYLPISTATYRIGQQSLTNDHNYERIKQRFQRDKETLEYLYTLFPEWGPFNDAPYYETQVWKELLRAAYGNNDFTSASAFARKIKKKDLSTKAALNPITFQAYRLYRFLSK